MNFVDPGNKPVAVTAGTATAGASYTLCVDVTVVFNNFPVGGSTTDHIRHCA